MTAAGASTNGIYLIRPSLRLQVDEGLSSISGLALTPDQTQLYALEPTTHWIWIYQIQPDGKLASKQRYGWLHVPDTAENANATALTCDRDGRLYVATSLGIQVLDQIGRVNAILPLPAGQPTQLYFGGPNFDTLYAICQDKVYTRRLTVKGAKPYEAPIKPATPKL